MCHASQRLTALIRIDAIWLAARRLTQGKFHWPSSRHGTQMEFSPEQLQALVIGLPWQRLGSTGAVRML